MRKKSVYVDYAATTPVDPRVLKAMAPYWNKIFGNPGSVHHFGQEAMAAVDMSREKIAEVLGVKFEEVIFTASTTEANNLVIQGVVDLYRKESKKKPKVLVSAIEHESVMEVARVLEKEKKIELVILPVDSEGRIKMSVLKRELSEGTALVSVMCGNNELGTLQDIRKIAAMVKEVRAVSKYPKLHTDAAQAFLYEEIKPEGLGIDFMTLSSHKMYGPKGVAVLYARQLQTTGSAERQYGLASQMPGGGQEFGLRSGTENVSLIVGVAEAVRLANKDRVKEVKRLRALRKKFVSELRKKKIKFEVNGPKDEKDLPHILNLRFPGVSAESLLVALDMEGIAASAGAACSMRSLEPSKVLMAIGLKEEETKESVRFSFGKGFGEKELRRVVGFLGLIISRLK